jgi:hypothetical protein
MADKAQHIMIHKLKAVRGMSDDAYRDALSQWGVQSCTQLNKTQAANLIRVWRQAAIREGRMKPKHQKFNEYAGRDDEWATPRQLRLIDVLWSTVSRAPAKKRGDALDTFLYNRFGIAGMGQVKRDMVGAIVATIEAMKR